MFGHSRLTRIHRDTPFLDCLFQCEMARNLLKLNERRPGEFWLTPQTPKIEELKIKMKANNDRAHDAMQVCMRLHLQSLVEKILDSPEILNVKKEFLDASTLQWLKEGVSGSLFNSYLHAELFPEGETVFFAFAKGDHKDAPDPLTLPLHLFFAIQLNSLQDRAEDPCSYWNQNVFERVIYRPLLELTFLLYSFTDPKFARRTRLTSA